MSAFRTEKQVLAHVEGQLSQIQGCYHQKIYLKFTSGFPDLIVGYDAHVAFYELKAWKGTLPKTLAEVKPIQRATIQRLRRSGLNAMAVLVKDLEEAWVWYPDLLEPLPLDNFTWALNREPARLQLLVRT